MITTIIWAFAICLCVYEITHTGLSITITHKQEIPPAVEIEPMDEDEEKEVAEMKANALNLMKKFNEEWSGLIDEERER